MTKTGLLSCSQEILVRLYTVGRSRLQATLLIKMDVMARDLTSSISFFDYIIFLQLIWGEINTIIMFF